MVQPFSYTIRLGGRKPFHLPTSPVTSITSSTGSDPIGRLASPKIPSRKRGRAVNKFALLRAAENARLKNAKTGSLPGRTGFAATFVGEGAAAHFMPSAKALLSVRLIRAVEILILVGVSFSGRRATAIF